jgi:hypothetical protein
VKDLAHVSKHVRIRRDPHEKKKLDDLETSLRASPKLREVDPDTDYFERQTS